MVKLPIFSLTRTNLRRALSLLMALALIIGGAAIAYAYVNCDSSHSAHSSVNQGKWYGCSGSAWHNSQDYAKIQMRSDWSSTDSLYARDTIQNANGRCLEMQVHYGTYVLGGITWSSNSSSANLDYDLYEYNVDIHLPMWGSVAYNSGYIINWIKCTGSSEPIGTSYVVQTHLDSQGEYCYNQTMCCLGNYVSPDGEWHSGSRYWYSSWTNGDRH